MEVTSGWMLENNVAIDLTSIIKNKFNDTGDFEQTNSALQDFQTAHR